MNLSDELEALFASLSGEVSKVAHETETAETADAGLTSEELVAAGEIMAHAFANRVLEKLAGSGVPAAGGGSENPIASPRSAWEQAAARLAAMHSRKLSVGDDTSVRAEDTIGNGAGHNKGKAGPTGPVNSQRALG